MLRESNQTTEKIIELIKTLPEREQKKIRERLSYLIQEQATDGNIGNKGKDIFTSSEMFTIKKLIKEKLLATPNQQKGVRQQIRNLGFYYTKYNTEGYRYDLDGFEFLINSGQIKVKKG